MTLYKRTLLVVALTLITLVIIVYVSSQIILLRGYQTLEQQATVDNVQRIRNSLVEQTEDLTSLAADWARWDDTYQFVDDLNQAYIDSNLVDQPFGTGLYALFYVNKDAEIVYEKAVDSTSLTRVAVPPALRAQIAPGSRLLTHAGPISEVHGLVALSDMHMKVAAIPITRSDRTGPINGTLIWAFQLTEVDIRKVAASTRLDVQVMPYEQPEMPEDFQQAKRALTDAAPFWVQPESESLVAGYALMEDINGQPTLILKTEIPRTVYAQGRASLSYFLVSLVVTGAAFTVVMLAMLERTVLSRLASLSSAMTRIRTTGDLSTPIDMAGSDELSNLARGTKNMLEALAKTQNDLRQTNATLDQRVTERTADLLVANTRLQEEIAERTRAQAFLAQARDHALDALRLKNQILANVSHDVRTPLTTIMLHAESLKIGRYGAIIPKQAEAVERVLVGARQLLHFITNLLAEAQVTSAEAQTVCMPFDPRQIVEEVVTISKPLALRKKLDLASEVTPDFPPTVWGDVDRVRLILTNLVDNAIKFTEQGQVVVRLLNADAARWALQVADTGQGIPPEAQPHIFEPFWQVDGSPTRQSNRGVGLGLSIVKQMTGTMGGEITLNSQPGVGSTFTVTLPLEMKPGQSSPVSEKEQAHV